MSKISNYSSKEREDSSDYKDYKRSPFKFDSPNLVSTQQDSNYKSFMSPLKHQQKPVKITGSPYSLLRGSNETNL